MQVGKSGDIGIAEITNMMVTVRGPTKGAVIVEWNVAESSLGSAGMWGEFRCVPVAAALSVAESGLC